MTNYQKRIDAIRAMTADERRHELDEVSYPGGTFALWDSETDTYWNYSGQKLKHANDYVPDNDGRYY